VVGQWRGLTNAKCLKLHRKVDEMLRLNGKQLLDKLIRFMETHIRYT